MLLEFIAKMQLPDRYMYMYMYVHVCTKLVDTLCRDGADMPIVCVHTKAFLTCGHSCSKPFWAYICISISILFQSILARVT